MENASPAVKYLSVSLAATLATVLSFVLMMLLITGELSRQPEIDISRISPPEITRIREREKPVVRKKVEKMIPAEMPPDHKGQILLPETNLVAKTTYPILDNMAELLATETPVPQISAPVKDLIPLMVVQPTYPFRAQMKEIEGFVLVQFSVRENGTVKNPIVIDSEPGSMFDEAALSAVSKFKFIPRQVAGDPIGVENIRLKFAFRLDSSAYVDQNYVD